MEQALTETLETIKHDTKGDKISIGELVEALNSRGYGPLLIGPALVTILPTGAIPGVPAICALLILFISGQILIGHSHPWLPEKLKSFSFERGKLMSGFQKIKPYTEQIDRYIYPRGKFLVKNGGNLLAAITSIILAITIVILGFIPFMAAIPALGVLLLGLGLSAKDGLMMGLAISVTLLSIGTVPYAYNVIFGQIF